jgi:WD40 repeat protein
VEYDHRSKGAELKRNTSSVYAVAFSHDDSLLASASRDRTISLWNPTTGQEVHKVEKELSKTISFSIYHETIITHHGAILIDKGIILKNDCTPRTTRGLSIHDAVTMKDSWLQQGLRNLLWLPYDYIASERVLWSTAICFPLANNLGISIIQLDYS